MAKKKKTWEEIQKLANQNQYGKGNIDLKNRPIVKNSDGSISTVRSMSFYDDKEKKEILVPTVVNGKVVSDDEAIKHYYKTGEYLGKFDTVKEANNYADQLHNQQANWYGKSLNNDFQKTNYTYTPQTTSNPTRVQQPMSTWDKVQANLEQPVTIDINTLNSVGQVTGGNMRNKAKVEIKPNTSLATGKIDKVSKAELEYDEAQKKKTERQQKEMKNAKTLPQKISTKTGQIFENVLQKPKALYDGFQVTDPLVMAGSTALSGVGHVTGGAFNAVNNLVQAGAYGVSSVAGMTGHEDFAKRLRAATLAAKQDIQQAEQTGYNVLGEKSSVLGSTGANALEGVGQSTLFGVLSRLGVKPLSDVLTFAGGASGSFEEAYSKEDIEDWQAVLQASGSGAISWLTENFNDVSGYGGTKWSKALKEKGSQAVSTGLGKALLRLNISATSEAGEEIAENLFGTGWNYILNAITDMVGHGAKFDTEIDVENLVEDAATSWLSTLISEGSSVAVNNAVESNQIIRQQEAEQRRKLSVEEKNQIKKDTLLKSENRIANQELIEESKLTDEQKQSLMEVANQYELSKEEVKKAIKDTLDGKYDTNEDRDKIINESDLNDEEKASLTRVANNMNLTNKQVKSMIENKANLEDSNKRYQTYNESASKFNIDTNNEAVKAIFNVANRRDVGIEYSTTYKDSNGQDIEFTDTENAVHVVEDNGKRTIVINPNAKTDKTLENLIVHEITHDMEGTKEYSKLANLLFDGAKKIKGNQQAYQSIYDSYANFYKNKGINKSSTELTEIARSEFVANTLGDQIGNEEFISYLMDNTEKTTMQKFIDAIGNIINRLTGYKDQERYWREVQDKYKAAFNAKYESREANQKSSIETQTSTKDSQGRTLTKEQVEFFKDSKIRDEDGSLKVMYHGTNADFNVFDKNKINIANLGKGFYFTDTKDIANSYADTRTSERGGKQRIVEAYINSVKPFDMGNVTREQAVDYLNYDFYNTNSEFIKRTREQARQEAEDFVNEFEQEQQENWGEKRVARAEQRGFIKHDNKIDYSMLIDTSNETFQNWLRENNYDSLLVPGQDKKSGLKGVAVVVFNSNQIKNIDNTNPTTNPDIRYSQDSTKDSKGRELSTIQQRYFKDSKVRDEEGRLLEVYHGTPTGGFNIFDRNKISNRATTHQWGYGFYFSNNSKVGDEYTRAYNNTTGEYGRSEKPQKYAVYLNINNPLVLSDTYSGQEGHDLDREKLKELILKGDSNHFFDSWIPFSTKTINELNYKLDGLSEEQIKNLSKEEKVDYWLRQEYDEKGIKNILQEMGRAYNNVSDLIDNFQKILGYDGIIVNGRNNTNQYIAFSPEQIKNVDNTKPTANPDIRYSVETEEFDKTLAERYPEPATTDNNGDKLAKGMADFMKNSKARDLRNGGLVNVFHTTGGYTSIPQFNEFDPRGDGHYKFGNQIVNYFTDDKEMSGSYANQEYNMADTQKVNNIDEATKYLNSVGDYTIEELDDGVVVFNNADREAFEKARDFAQTLDDREKNILRDMLNTGSYELFLDENPSIDTQFYEDTYKLYEKFLNNNKLLTDVTHRYSKPLQSFLSDFLNGKGFQPTKTYDTTLDFLKSVKGDFSKGTDFKNYGAWQYSGYVNIQNPYVIDAKGRNWNNISSGLSKEGERLLDIFDYMEENKIAYKTKRLFDHIEYTKQKEAQDFFDIQKKANDIQYEILGHLGRHGEITRDMLNDLMAKITYQDYLEHRNDIIDGRTIEEIGKEHNKIFSENYGYDLYKKLQEENPTLKKVDYKDVSTLYRMDKRFDRSYLEHIFEETGQTNDIVKKVIEYNNSLFDDNEERTEAQDLFGLENVYKNRTPEEILNMGGYDGVIIKNVVDYGGSASNIAPHDLYVTFGSNQFKAKDNENPTNDPDIRYSINTKLKNTKALDEEGNPIKLYHGTNRAGFNKVKDYLFLTDNRTIAENYAGGNKTYDPNNPNDNLTPILTNNQKTYLKTVKDIKDNIREYKVKDLQALWDYIDENNGFKDVLNELSNKEINSIIKNSNSGLVDEIVEATLEELENWKDTDRIPLPKLQNEKVDNLKLYSENRKVYETYANIENPLEVDLMGGKITQEMIQNAKKAGYDGIIAKNTSEGRGNQRGNTYVVFNENQLVDANNPDVTYSKETSDKWQEFMDRWHKNTGKGTKLKDAKLPQKQEVKLPTKQEKTPNFDDLDDVFSEIGEDSVESPLKDRNIETIGKETKTNAYQYENPEVKPYFQEMAQLMGEDLSYINDPANRRTKKGGGSTLIANTEAIDDLHNKFGYSYEQIGKGLNSIINDEGTENNAVSKKIEFYLDEALRNGYINVFGKTVEPNQNYINTIQPSININENQPQLPQQEKLNELYKTTKEEDLQAIRDNSVQNTNPEITPETVDEGIEKDTLKYLVEGRTQQKMKNLKDEFLQKFVNKGHYIDKLAKKTGDKDLTYKYDRMLSSFAEAQVSIGDEHVIRVNGVNQAVGKSLNDIYKPAEEAGLSKEFDDYLLNRHNIDRYAYEKGVYGNEVSAQDSKKNVEKYEKEHPIFKEWAEEVYRYNRYEIQGLVNAGLISQEFYNKLVNMYGSYVPTFRDIQEMHEELVGEGTVGHNAIKKATGSKKPIINPKLAMAEQTIAFRKAIATNEVGKELYKILGKDSKVFEGLNFDNLSIESIGGNVIEKAKDGFNTFTIFNKGQATQFKISDDLYTAFDKNTLIQKVNNNELASALLTPVEKLTKKQRNLLTTYSIGFAFNNPLKDYQDALYNTKYTAPEFAKNYTVALHEIATNGKFYQDAKRNGLGANTYYDFKSGILPETKNKFKMVGNKIQDANQIIELAPRLAEYITTLEHGGSVDEALYNAAEITTNFKRGGDITKAINKYGVNFVNASIQGLDKQIRNITENNSPKGYARLLFRAVALGVLPSVINHLLLDDDDDYQDLPDYIKDSYYLLPSKEDGKFYRIPKGRVLAVIGATARRTIELAQGESDAFDDYWKEVWGNNLAPNNPLTDNLLAPILQAANNKAWYEGEIVGNRLQKKPKAEQSDERTDKFSKLVGESIGKLPQGVRETAEKLPLGVGTLFKIVESPKLLNYVLDQYSGGIGDIVLPHLTPFAEDSMLANKFTTNAILKNKNVEAFYEALENAEITNNSDYATDSDKLVYKYLSGVSKDVGSLYSDKREIQNDSTLKDKEKKAKTLEIQKEINKQVEEALEKLNEMKLDNDYASFDGTEYYKNDKGDWKEIDNEDVATGLSNQTYADYKNKSQQALSEKKKRENKDNVQLTDREKISLVLSSSYTNKEKDLIYDNYIRKDTDNDYAAYKLLNGIDNIDDYLNYKSADFTSNKIDDGTVNGKSVKTSDPGSKKNKTLDYLANSNFDELTRLYLYGTNYKLSADKEKLDRFETLLNKRNLTPEEKKQIYLTLNGVVEMKDGSIEWQ